jgi:hypothetical protein
LRSFALLLRFDGCGLHLRKLCLLRAQLSCLLGSLSADGRQLLLQPLVSAFRRLDSRDRVSGLRGQRICSLRRRRHVGIGAFQVGSCRAHGSLRGGDLALQILYLLGVANVDRVIFVRCETKLCAQVRPLLVVATLQLRDDGLLLANRCL